MVNRARRKAAAIACYLLDPDNISIELWQALEGYAICELVEN